jgi:hypothetical protein
VRLIVRILLEVVSYQLYFLWQNLKVHLQLTRDVEREVRLEDDEATDFLIVDLQLTYQAVPQHLLIERSLILILFFEKL